MSVALGITQAIDGALGTAGTIIETIGLGKQFAAEEEAARQLAVLIQEQTLVDAERERKQSSRLLGRQRGQMARSGISLQGSQLDLMIDNARELELNAVHIERFGDAAAAQANARAKALKKAAKRAKVAGIIQSFKVGG